MNCDGRATQADLPLFAQTLVNPSGGSACNFSGGDLTGDGRNDGGDIEPFIVLLGCNAASHDPSTAATSNGPSAGVN